MHPAKTSLPVQKKLLAQVWHMSRLSGLLNAGPSHIP